MSFNPLNSQLPKQQTGILFLGTVVNNNDPLGLDRVQCSVPQLYDPQLGDVPWCMPIKSCWTGQGNGFGYFGVPPVGSTVLIELQDNDANFPVYRGYWMQSGIGIQPGVFVHRDASGSQLQIDTNTNTTTYSHANGTTVIVNPQGVSVHVEGNTSVDITGNATVQTGGNADVTVGGNASVKSNDISVQGNNINYTCTTFDVSASTAQFHCPVHCVSINTTYGTGGTGATITGGIRNTGGTIESNGIVLDTHTHTAQGEHAETTGPH